MQNKPFRLYGTDQAEKRQISTPYGMHTHKKCGNTLGNYSRSRYIHVKCPTTMTSAALKNNCKILDAMSGNENKSNLLKMEPSHKSMV